MRRLLILLICSAMLCSAACAETVGASYRKGLYRGDFVCAYCEESDTYWFVAPRYVTVWGRRIPLIPKQYCIYSMKGDFSNVMFHMSTSLLTKNILPTANGIYYEREVFLNPMALELCYYDAATQRDKWITPAEGLLAHTPDTLIYLDNDNCIRERTMATGKELRYSVNNVRYYTAEGLYCGDSFDDIQFYSYRTGQSTPVTNPESGIRFYAGYGYLLSETGHLYRSGEKTELIADLGAFTTCTITDEYACVFGRLNDSDPKGILRYIRFSEPSRVHTLEIDIHDYGHINLCNNYVFVYHQEDAAICALDLITQEETYICLP